MTKSPFSFELKGDFLFSHNIPLAEPVSSFSR